MPPTECYRRSRLRAVFAIPVPQAVCLCHNAIVLCTIANSPNRRHLENAGRQHGDGVDIAGLRHDIKIMGVWLAWKRSGKRAVLRMQYRMALSVRAICAATVFGLAACASDPGQGPDPYAALTEIDVTLAAMLLQRTLDHAPDGTTRRWTNDESGHSGAITPVRSYIASSGQYCRDYREDISINGESRNFHYSACREEDRWGL